MDHSPNGNRYFAPMDEVAETLIQTLDEIPERDIREFRRHFLDSYLKSKPIDPKMKEWRKFVGIESPPDLKLAGAPQYKEIDSDTQPGGKDEFAGVVDIEEKRIRFWMNREYRTQGIHFCHFDQAIHEKLVDPEKIGRIREIGLEDRFSLLSRGSANHMICLSIPDGIHVKKPFLINILSPSPGLMLPILAGIFAGHNSDFNLIVNLNSSTRNGGALIPIGMYFFAGASSKIGYLESQRFNHHIHYFPRQEFFLDEDAVVEYLSIDRGGAIVKRGLHMNLEGMAAKAAITGLYTLSGNQKFIFDTRQNHYASQTRSDLLFKGILDGDSYALWKGNIFVKESTQGVDGYQMNKILLLDRRAHAESIPGLEISADDVKCSHGVVLSDIDPDQLFYLASRGIGPEDGTQLIVQGFMEDAVGRMAAPAIYEYATRELTRKG